MRLQCLRCVVRGVVRRYAFRVVSRVCSLFVIVRMYLNANYSHDMCAENAFCVAICRQKCMHTDIAKFILIACIFYIDDICACGARWEKIYSTSIT